ncbi:MAG: ATP-dependent RecD-like DNA helicase, partial [Bacilli bacterium]
MAYIKGNIKQIIYKTDKGFTVGLFKVLDTDELDSYLNKLITFTGTFNEIKTETSYILYGDLKEHPRYGEQFDVAAYEQIMPESTNGIISFLSSKLFPGVGVKLATRIVDTLGESTLDLISDDYHNLLIVPSITEKKAMKIQNILKKENESYKIIINLQKSGFSMNEASKIYKYYKESSLSIINDNIYAIVNDVEGIGFLTVDRIAAQMEIREDDERRIEACIIYIMNDLCISNGNVYNELEGIFLGVSNYLHFTFTIEDLNYHLLKLNKEGKIIIEGSSYYLKDYYEAEVDNASFITKLLNNDATIFNNLDKKIKHLEKEYNLQYSDKQILAITS